MGHTILTMTRGNAHKIAEWVEYHARLGFDDIQVVLDGDIDGTEPVLRKLDVPADVTIHPRAEMGDYHDQLSLDERQERVLEWRQKHAAELASGAMRGSDPQTWRQHLHFSEIMAPYAAGERGRGWLALIDVDEFLVLDEHRSIRNLTAGTDSSRLRFLNFNVDTADHDPSRPVLEQHTVRWSRDDVLAHPNRQLVGRVKSMVRYRVARLKASLHVINHGPGEVLDHAVARLHHFRVPGHFDEIPFTVHDPVSMPG